MISRARLGAAEADAFAQAILRDFLCRAELLGWVTKRGRLSLRARPSCTAYWAGVRHTQDALGMTLFDENFLARLSICDPIVTARGRHVELCNLARKRTRWRVTASPLGQTDREGWMA